MDNLRAIVNGSHLAAFTNKKISITGFVVDQAQNGLSFDIRTADNQIVKIHLKRKVDHPLEGYVEVHGVSSGKGVNGDDFVIFSNNKFDAKAYNKLSTLLTSVPQLWNTSSTS